jgi:hypothetical protein
MTAQRLSVMPCLIRGCLSLRPGSECNTALVVVDDALLAGGFALAGVALQQSLSLWSDSRRTARDEATRYRSETHDAFVKLVAAGRHVQRALVDRDQAEQSPAVANRLAEEIDRLEHLTLTPLIETIQRFEASQTTRPRRPH